MSAGSSQIPLQGVVSDQASMNPKQQSVRFALFKEDGSPVDLGSVGTEPTGAQVVLTGYSGQSAANVAATDTINHAIAKLEARIAALEA